MARINLRLTADTDATAALIKQVEAMEGVERAEEVADLMLGKADPDSSSAGLPDDVGPGAHAIVVETANEDVSDQVRARVQTLAGQFGAAVEFVDRF